jgi:hypothetical protein
MKHLFLIAFALFIPFAGSATASEVARKAAALPKLPDAVSGDWLIKRVSRPAGVFSTDRPGEIAIDNGLLRRSFLVSPNLACVELMHLQTNESMLRSVRPECRVTLDGQEFDVGGLKGQPVDNFLRPEWHASLTNDPAAFQLADFTSAPIQARFAWKPRPEWMSTTSGWY